MIREVRITALVRKCFVDYSLPASAVKLGTSRTRNLDFPPFPKREAALEFPLPVSGRGRGGVFQSAARAGVWRRGENGDASFHQELPAPEDLKPIIARVREYDVAKRNHDFRHLARIVGGQLRIEDDQWLRDLPFIDDLETQRDLPVRVSERQIGHHFRMQTRKVDGM